MKVTILLALFISSNLISISAGDHCQCNCCIRAPSDPDCQVELVGTVAIDSCPADSTLICEEKCRQQFPAQCNQNNSVAEGGCSFDSTSSMKPTTTTILNGPVMLLLKTVIYVKKNVMTPIYRNVLNDQQQLLFSVKQHLMVTLVERT
ncbi:unnamed protein product [Adineta ricciae]|uniref:Secreted protein n=1 Tax=Adineta ricciae TaxID=249248 RepID=A0A814F0T4_ADIRI|nr:unnamed protein product [Adineta ricciae]